MSIHLGRAAARLIALAALPALLASGCAGQQSDSPAGTRAVAAASPAARQGQTGAGPPNAPSPAAAPSSGAVAAAPAPLRVRAAHAGAAWEPVAWVRGQVAAWAAERGGVSLLRFEQQLAHLRLHAGSLEPGGSGWLHGDRISGAERHTVIAGFNSGFKLDQSEVGFMLNGRVAVPLRRGLASIVIYRDGITAIGLWGEGVPAPGYPIASVRQNLRLLADRGRVAPTVNSCVQECWGSTLGGGVDVARSALGITATGQLVWAAGESLSPAALARALVGAGARRAVELDINPEWVAGYLYLHGGSGPRAAPVVPGQPGIPGQLLAPYSRDFFTVLAG